MSDDQYPYTPPTMNDSLPPQQFYAPPGPPLPVKTSGSAIAALVLGILSFCCFGPLTGIPAIICGIIALTAISGSYGQMKGKGLAIGGIVMGALSFIMIGLMAAIMLPALARAREAARRASCQNNLKQAGLIFYLYSDERPDGLFPQLSAQKGCLMFQGTEVYPDYLADPRILHCPSDAEAYEAGAGADSINDDSYLYLGYILENEAQLRLLAEAYHSPEFDPTQDIKVPPGQGNGGSDTLYRLRRDIDAIYDGLEPAQSAMKASSIPVMMDKVEIDGPVSMFNHVPGVANVLFLDGHVEFIRFMQKFPVTEEAVELLNAMDRSPG